MAQALPQVLAFDIFENQEDFALLFQDVVDRGNVRVDEAGGAFGFFEKTMAVERIGAQGGSQTLQGDGAFELGVFGAVDLAHAPLPQPFPDAETPDDGATQRLLWLCRIRQTWLKFRHIRLNSITISSVPKAS